MARRECPFCGKNVSAALTQCVFCRETLPALPSGAKHASDDSIPDGGSQVRRGMLYMLLAAVIGYFGGGYSAMMLPFPLNPVLTTYFSPMLFLGGLGLCAHGYYLQHKSATHSSA